MNARRTSSDSPAVQSVEAPDPENGLAELADAILRIARDLEPHGPRGVDVVRLTGTEATVMRWVHRNAGTSPSAAAVGTGTQRSNLSATLSALEAKGMVERRRNPDDARLVQLFATDLAEREIARLRRHWSERLTHALGGDTAGAAEALALLERIDEGLREDGSRIA